MVDIVPANSTLEVTSDHSETPEYYLEEKKEER